MARLWDKSKPPRGPWSFNKDSLQAIGLNAWWPSGGASAAPYVPDRVELGAPGLSASGQLMGLGASGQPMLQANGSSAWSSGTFNQLLVPTLPTFHLDIVPYSLTNAYTGLLTILATDYCQIFVKSDGKLAIYFHGSAGAQQYDGTGVFTLAVRMQYGVTVQCTSGVMTGYVNGQTDATTVPPGNVTISSGTLGIGYDTNTAGRVLTGLIGNVRIYNGGITPGCIQAINDPATRYELWYPLRSKKWIAGGTTSVFIPIIGRGPGMALAGHSGLVG